MAALAVRAGVMRRVKVIIRRALVVAGRTIAKAYLVVALWFVLVQDAENDSEAFWAKIFL